MDSFTLSTAALDDDDDDDDDAEAEAEGEAEARPLPQQQLTKERREEDFALRWIGPRGNC